MGFRPTRTLRNFPQLCVCVSVCLSVRLACFTFSSGFPVVLFQHGFAASLLEVMVGLN